MGCTLLIREGMSHFTHTEKALAEYLLTHRTEAVHMSTKQLAGCCGVSPAMVVRFSQKLGFDGFTALKLDLAQENGNGVIEDDGFRMAIRDNDDMATVVRKAEEIQRRNLSRTYRMIRTPVLEGAVEALCRCRHIHLFGIGASGLLALDFHYKSSRIGIPSFYYADPQTNLATAALLDAADVVIAISYSGETRETVLAARTAKAHGCSVIAITQANHNTLARLADFPLYIPGEEKEFRVGAMTSRTSGLLLLDLLYLGVAKHDPQRTENSLRNTHSIIQDLREK